MKLSDRVQIDDESDVVSIDGCKIAGAVLDFFTRPSRPHHWFRIVSVENGVIIVETKVEASTV